MLAPRSARILMTSFKPRSAAPCRAVKSASFTALMSAPASSSMVTAASAEVERAPRLIFGLNVQRPSPEATINGVVPSSDREGQIRAGLEERLNCLHRG